MSNQFTVEVSDTLTEEYLDYPQGKEDEIKILEKRLGEYETPKNVAIIGPPRVGKSSFINSVIASFSSICWRERTMVGLFEQRREQVTRHLIRIRKEEYLDSGRQKRYPYPTLIDMNGFNNEYSEITKEQLRYVLFGLVPHEHRIQDTIKISESKDGRGIREACLSSFEPLKVDCLIFVASSDSPLPGKLIEAVKQVSLREERVIPVFGVLTKKDKCVDDPKRIECKKRDFCSKLGIPENRFLLCTNYCDDYDRKIGQSRCDRVYPELDVPILNFMTQVFDVGIKVIQDSGLPVNAKSSGKTTSFSFYFFVGLAAVVLFGVLAKNR